jgi:Zn-dependent oligopeptidase
MKRILAVSALLLTAAFPAAAQGGRAALTPEQIQHQKQQVTERWRLYLFSGITLSESQKAKANDIIAKWADADAALDKNRSPDDPVVPAFRAKHAELEGKRNSDLAAILTSQADKARFDKNAKTASSN